ncbi:MAG: hypothetical protein KGH94_02855 [Candidatus Micrarchaeota archaeon]|nr:hypothetical protein [Candidatus Micrarchaeota archaeon]
MGAKGKKLVSAGIGLATVGVGGFMAYAGLPQKGMTYPEGAMGCADLVVGVALTGLGAVKLGKALKDLLRKDKNVITSPQDWSRN